MGDETGNTAIIVNMIRDVATRLDNLSSKVDTLSANQVTRHEFDSLIQRIDTFVVKSEYEQYKVYNEAQLNAFRDNVNNALKELVPRNEHEKRWEEDAKRFKGIYAKLPTGKVPQWVITALIALGAAGFGSYTYHAFAPAMPAIVQQVNTSHASH